MEDWGGGSQGKQRGSCDGFSKEVKTQPPGSGGRWENPPVGGEEIHTYLVTVVSEHMKR